MVRVDEIVRSKNLPLGKESSSRLENLYEVKNGIWWVFFRINSYGKIPVPRDSSSESVVLEKWRQNVQIHECGSTNDKRGHHHELKMIEKFNLLRDVSIIERTNDSSEEKNEFHSHT